MSLVDDYHKEHLARRSRIEAKAFGKPIPAQIVPEKIEKIAEPEPLEALLSKPPLGVECIKRAVCRHFGISREQIASRRRDASITFPRHIAIFMCWKKLTVSTTRIGKAFGGLDHSTVIYGARKIEGLLGTDAEVADHIADIEAIL